MDEFAACLDRDTAKLSLITCRKSLDNRAKQSLQPQLIATYKRILKPCVLVRKRFGEEIQINYYPNESAAECSLIKEMRVEVGNREDWNRLSGFHYRGHKVAVPRKIFRLVEKMSFAVS